MTLWFGPHSYSDFFVCGGRGGGGGLNLLQEVFKQGFWKIFVMRYLVDFMFVPRPEVSLVPRVALWSGLWFERHEFYYWTEFDCQLLKLFKLTFDVMLYYLHHSVKTNYKDLLSNFHRSSYCWHVQPCSFNLVINRKCTENSCKQQAQTCWSCVASAVFFLRRREKFWGLMSTSARKRKEKKRSFACFPRAHYKN